MGWFCCRRDAHVTKDTHHEDRRLCGNPEATCQDIREEVKAWVKKAIPTDDGPQQTSHVVPRCLQDENVDVLEGPDLETGLSSTASVSRDEPKFLQTVERSLSKLIQNI